MPTLGRLVGYYTRPIALHCFDQKLYIKWGSCECTHCVGLLAIVPPQSCEAILIEIL